MPNDWDSPDWKSAPPDVRMLTIVAIVFFALAMTGIVLGTSPHPNLARGGQALAMLSMIAIIVIFFWARRILWKNRTK
jgi:hypothetical protein